MAWVTGFLLIGAAQHQQQRQDQLMVARADVAPSAHLHLHSASGLGPSGWPPQHSIHAHDEGRLAVFRPAHPAVLARAAFGRAQHSQLAVPVAVRLPPVVVHAHAYAKLTIVAEH